MVGGPESLTLCPRFKVFGLHWVVGGLRNRRRASAGSRVAIDSQVSRTYYAASDTEEPGASA